MSTVQIAAGKRSGRTIYLPAFSTDLIRMNMARCETTPKAAAKSKCCAETAILSGFKLLVDCG